MLPTLASFVLLVAFGTSAQATVVTWYTTRDCNSASEEFRVGCNTCIDPPGGMFILSFTIGYVTDDIVGAPDWWGAAIADIGPNQRVSYHNQDKCTPKSMVGQWYGPGCRVAGRTALRSVWVACEGNRIAGNTTEEADAVEVADLE